MGDSGAVVYILNLLFFNPLQSGSRVVILPSGAMRTLFSSDQCAEPGMCGNSWRGSWNVWKLASAPARGTMSEFARSVFLWSAAGSGLVPQQCASPTVVCCTSLSLEVCPPALVAAVLSLCFLPYHWRFLCRGFFMHSLPF